MSLDLDLAAMLRALFDTGWAPALLAEPENGNGGTAVRWVCFPQGPVRAYLACRADDPVGAVRGLYQHALAHPNAVPTFPAPRSSPLDQRFAVCARECDARRTGRSCACVERGFLAAPPAPEPWYAQVHGGVYDG